MCGGFFCFYTIKYKKNLYIKKFIEYNVRVKQQRKDQMADKTTKKTVAKKAPAKKTTVKKTVAVKSAPKKTVTKKAVAAAPVAEKFPCGCDKNCACGGNCAEHKHCKCHKCGFVKKLILFLVIFALGFAVASMTQCDKRGKMGPRPEFNENGCLVVKCPKMAEKMPMMDANQDGCVTKAEFKAAKKHMRRGPRPEDASAEAPAEVPAPEVAE